ncbi:hypothetical protein GCM10007387_50120 [Pseudoduganella albidiflava]|uniref:Uncharacterized protein n=1 Tax=Pseudoduganella albidiflava TaxID=321983 RepID=A0AA87Y0T4_9BURK|nr:hypothetical protein GCM10007387_50120 [Pseudoduganella albidiflava]
MLQQPLARDGAVAYGGRRGNADEAQVWWHDRNIQNDEVPDSSPPPAAGGAAQHVTYEKGVTIHGQIAVLFKPEE